MSWSAEDDTLQWRGGPARTTSSLSSCYRAPWKKTNKTINSSRPVSTANDKAVELISNCYGIKFATPLKQIIYQYKIHVTYSSSTGDLDEESLPNHVKRMTSDKMPRELRRQIAELALGECITQLEENWLYRLDQNCFTILYTNFDLFLECKSRFGGGDRGVYDCQINLPYCHGSQKQTLTYSVEFKKMRFDDPRKALNVILSSQDEHTIIYQSAAQTVEFSSQQQHESIPFKSNVHLVHGNCHNLKPFAVGSTLSISCSPGLFYEPMNIPKKLTNILREEFKIDDLSQKLEPETVDKLRSLLVGRHIEVTYCRYGDSLRKFRVLDLIGSAHDSFNLTKHDTEVSIVDHYKTKYGIVLEYPQLPCIATDRHLRTKLPLELCRLCANSKVSGELDPDDLYNFGRKSNKRPLEFFSQIEEYAKKIIEGNEVELEKIGVSIQRQPIKVMGTVIPPIWLAGADRDKPMVPTYGSYDARWAKFLRPIKMKKFCVTLIGDEETFANQFNELQPEVLSKFIKEYCQAGQFKGVEVDVEHAQVEIIIDEKEDLLREKLRRHVEELNKQSVDHSIMVLPTKNAWIYAHLQFLETRFQFDDSSNPLSGRRTRLSCLKLTNLCQILNDSEEKNQSFYQSLWSKYNAKLGGVNYILKSNKSFELPDYDVLILGIFIGQKSIKLDYRSYSIASVLGMCSPADEDYSTYTRLRAQPTFDESNKSTIEQVLDIDLMLSDILDSYASSHDNKYPAKILILRDGVSASQFEMVETVELEKIKTICKSKYGARGQLEPLISCFIIQRRHDVRFRLASPCTIRGGKETYNMQTGTIVDADAIRPDRFVFFSAQPQNVPNFGTARPPFTCKITNGIMYSSRQVQRLILALCYLSPRSTDCTSVPTPVDLAEQASERGKNIALGWKEMYLAGDKSDKDSLINNQLEQLNDYFSNLGKDAYLNTLFYV